MSNYWEIKRLIFIEKNLGLKSLWVSEKVCWHCQRTFSAPPGVDWHLRSVKTCLISTFKPFIFCVLFYLYDLRFFPVLFFSYLSTYLILHSSLPTLVFLILPFFRLRNTSLPNIFLYFYLLFCFCFCFSFPLVSNLPLHHRHFTPFFTSLF